MAALNLISLSLSFFFFPVSVVGLCVNHLLPSRERTSLLKGNAPYSNRLESEAHFLKKDSIYLKVYDSQAAAT